MSLGTILLIVLILMLVGVVPTWPHSKGWGYAPSGIVGVLLLIVLVLLLMGRLQNIGAGLTPAEPLQPKMVAGGKQKAGP